MSEDGFKDFAWFCLVEKEEAEEGVASAGLGRALQLLVNSLLTLVTAVGEGAEAGELTLIFHKCLPSGIY